MKRPLPWPPSRPDRPVPTCPGRLLSRRDFLARAAVGAAALPAAFSAGAAPRAVTAIGACRRYELGEVRRVLAVLFDELGGLGRLVRDRHVTVKANLVNTSQEDLSGVPLELAVTVHPVVALALGRLLVEAGARQVVFAEQLPFRAPDEEAFAGYGFHLARFSAVMEGRVRFANTRNRGPHGGYARVEVPGGGELASAWEVNRTYVDTDVLVSLTKLKSHVSAGITAGMKNLFGIPPSSLYGEDLAGEPDEDAIGYRNDTMHACTRKPLTSADWFTGRSVEGDHGFNVPRFIVDLTAAFPVQLVVIDAVSTIQAAEGWWLGSMVTLTRPGLLIAGLNPVCTDAVAAAVMGFDPEAPDRQWPFVNGTNYLALARHRGLGENRISELDVAGLDLARARCQFQPTYRRTAP